MADIRLNTAANLKKDTTKTGEVIRVNIISKIPGVIEPNFPYPYDYSVEYEHENPKLAKTCLITVLVPVLKEEKEKFDKIIKEMKIEKVKTIDVFTKE
jgi:hypothetical protein